MARLRALLARPRVRARLLLRSLLLRLRRWLVGMAERCCRARRCGLVSLVVERREAEIREAKIVGAVKSVAGAGGIAGVDAMSSAGVVAMDSVRVRRGRSIGQSRL